jgi:molecular chaperone GrpE
VSDSEPIRPEEAGDSQADPRRDRDQALGDPVVEEQADANRPAGREREELEVAGADLDGQLEQLRAELEEAKDRALRTQAELENYRKRVARQMAEERRYADLPLIRDLLPVWDNIGRAIEAAEKAHRTASLREDSPESGRTPGALEGGSLIAETANLLTGIKMVSGQLEGVLERHHCTKIDALNQPFDPNFHEAISQRPSNTHAAGIVLQVTQTGFRLHDRVVRPSQVIVSAAWAENTDPAQAQAEEAGQDPNQD